MKNAKIRGREIEKIWEETMYQEIEGGYGQADRKEDKAMDSEAIERVSNFMHEDDETFFQRIIQGLTLPEIEEFLQACPEFRPFWNQDRNGC